MHVFTTFCGLTLGVFKQLDAERRAALEADILALIDQYNRAIDGTMVVDASYNSYVMRFRTELWRCQACKALSHSKPTPP